MAKQNLPVNYKDDVMSSSMGAKRRWQITQNTDGTYNIEDVTTYDQVGSEFGAGDINATNKAVNESADAGKIIDDPDTAGATTQNGYIAGVQLFNHVNDSLQNLFSDTIETVKLPFTATQSGMLYVLMKENNNTSSYLYLNSAILGNDICHISTPVGAGQSKTQWIPIVKGDTISVRLQSCASQTYKFLPF